VKVPPFVAVEIVHQGTTLGDLISDNQAIDGHASSFLFDMGIVIFVISSAAGKAYGLFTISEVTEQMIIEELTAIIGIKAQKRKRKYLFDVLICSRRLFLLCPRQPLFSPSRGDIDEIDGIGKHAIRESPQ